MFNQRLQLARKRAGLSLRDLAERIDNQVSHQAIKKYEDGIMYPSSRVLVSLGKALGVSIDFLMGNQVEALLGVEFRQHTGTNQKDRAHVEAAVIETVEKYLEVEGALELEETPINLGKVTQTASITSFEDVERRAADLREEWMLGTDPIPSMTALLEEKGFKVIEVDLPSKIFGLTCEVQRGNDQPPLSVIIVGANNNNVERRRFTLAHELAHKVIGENIKEGMNKERVMDRFASAFLVPGERLIKEIGPVRHAFAYRELIRLKHHYGVSAASFLMRLRDLGIISPEAVTTAYRTYARTWRTKEPEPLDLSKKMPIEKPMRFEQLVYRALVEHMISLPRASELLGRSIQSLEEEVKGPNVHHANHRQ